MIRLLDPSILRRAVLLVLTAFLSMQSPAASVSPAEALLQSRRPLVIAHRGFSLLAPENTTLAFERAVAAGADLVELDDHHSKDGQLVVIHDGTLDRTTDAVQRWGGKDLRVADRTLEELRELNAGGWFNPPCDGVRLPTLEEALSVIQRGSVTLIERKGGDAAACVALLHQRNRVNQVVVQSFDWDYLRDYRQLDARQVLGALGPPGSRAGRKLTDSEKALSPQWLDEVKALGVQLAVWNRQVDAPAVQAAHARGLRVWVYTINDLDTAFSLLRAGVDGIITDNPALLWKAVALSGRGTP
jgi:glycerophosphoryl diester phosphodiesterase